MNKAEKELSARGVTKETRSNTIAIAIQYLYFISSPYSFFYPVALPTFRVEPGASLGATYSVCWAVCPFGDALNNK